tara:strand:+ start:246 stop:518 length:273 start_codon:yes stop_codon:yes gene_type:complete
MNNSQTFSAFRSKVLKAIDPRDFVLESLQDRLITTWEIDDFIADSWALSRGDERLCDCVGFAKAAIIHHVEFARRVEEAKRPSDIDLDTL